MFQKLRWRIAQAAEIRWWQNYLSRQSKEDYLAWKKRYWTTFLSDIELQVANNASVLDLGCGPAGIFILFDPTHTNVVALDPLLEQYEAKLPHFKQKDYPNTTFLNLPLEGFDPILQGQSDVVFCLNAINHVADLERSFDILVASVKHDGDLVVSIDAHNYAFFKHLFRLLPGDILHPHQYDLTEYKAMLTSRGYTISKELCYKKEFFFDYYVLVAKKRKTNAATS
jgi:SAM-dependent methyltransferase